MDAWRPLMASELFSEVPGDTCFLEHGLQEGQCGAGSGEQARVWTTVQVAGVCAWQPQGGWRWLRRCVGAVSCRRRVWPSGVAVLRVSWEIMIAEQILQLTF